MDSVATMPPHERADLFNETSERMGASHGQSVIPGVEDSVASQ